MWNKLLCLIEYVSFIILKTSNRSCIKHCYTVKNNPIDFTIFTGNWLPEHLQEILRAPVDYLQENHAWQGRVGQGG